MALQADPDLLICVAIKGKGQRVGIEDWGLVVYTHVAGDEDSVYELENR